MSELIRLSGIKKSYRVGDVDVPVLRGIDLTIEEGERIVIVGRSGSGKSTLMNILGFLDSPTSGAHDFQGSRVNGMDDDGISMLRGRTIGFVFQQFHLLRGLTILENVELPMEYLHVPPPERRARSKELLERVGLGHRLDHLPRQLSGGEQQRVAVARALENHPTLLLADEPTGNLDSKAQDQVLELFDALHRDTGVTMVVVTHDPEIAERAGRIVHVLDGRIDGGAP